MSSPIVIGRPPAATDWRCADSGCRSLLGRKHSHGNLIIKYKDFLADISGSYSITIHCRKCGVPNTLSTESYNNLLDMVKNNG